MKALVSQHSIIYTKPQSSPSPSLFHFPNSKQSFLHISRIKRFASVRANLTSDSASCGGWDELSPIGGLEESDDLRKFLACVGIDDKKHVFVFVFMLGVVCAFAVSRFRVSSIVVVPVAVLVFAVGFSVGVVRSSSGVGGASLNGNKRRVKEEILAEKLRVLVEIFDGFSVKVNDLKSDVQRAIDSREITVSDLESYVEAMVGIRVMGEDGKRIVEESIENSAKLNQKVSKSKKEAVEIGYELWQSVGGYFEKMLAGSKTSSKVKSSAKRESVEKSVGDQSRGGDSVLKKSENNAMEMDFGSVDESVGIADLGRSQDSLWSGLNESGNGRIKRVPEEVSWGSDRVKESIKYDYQSNRLQFMSNGHISSKTGRNHHNEMWDSHENLLDSVDFSVGMKHAESKASSVQEQSFKESEGDSDSSLLRDDSKDETNEPQIRAETVNHEDNFPLDDHPPGHDSELPSFSSSSIQEDVLFDRYVTEANDLLKQAKEFIKATHNDEYAEIVLYRSAKLLSKAITMKPMSLLAVGQLGNTYLLHGEMKLRISRELRMHLTRRDPLSVEKWIRMNDKITSKDDIASVLINVCEECEELLVEAGRKYRLALSIDGNDVRALYNWGLALTFRGQLVADIGPGAVFDADELFLAAIDKFNAMMSKGNAYAPDALFRWGIALQQRSHLRPRNGKEKVKLLQQAKRLYEDALNMDSNNVQVRRALSSCMSELSSRHLYY